MLIQIHSAHCCASLRCLSLGHQWHAVSPSACRGIWSACADNDAATEALVSLAPQVAPVYEPGYLDIRSHWRAAPQVDPLLDPAHILTKPCGFKGQPVYHMQHNGAHHWLSQGPSQRDRVP